MNPVRLRQMLADTFGEKYESSSEDQFRIDCINPDCHDQKGHLEINLRKGIFHCWLCDYSGNIRQLFKAVLGKVPNIDEFVSADELKNFPLATSRVERIIERTTELPNEFKPLWNKDEKLSITGQHALKYALSRMSWEEVERYRVGYCGYGSYKNRLIIPCFEEGKVVYFVGRALYKGMAPPYLNSKSPRADIIFNYDQALKVGKAALVEGVFDAIAIGDEPPVVGIASLGTSITEEQKFKLDQIEDLTIMLDNDAKIKTFNLTKFLTYRPKIVILRDNRDPDQYQRSQLHEMILAAKRPTLEEDILTRASQTFKFN